MELLMKASVAIDGSKKAVNNHDKNFTRNKVERRRQRLEPPREGTTHRSGAPFARAGPGLVPAAGLDDDAAPPPMSSTSSPSVTPAQAVEMVEPCTAMVGTRRCACDRGGPPCRCDAVVHAVMALSKRWFSPTVSGL
jgi:hypothetical protein